MRSKKNQRNYLATSISMTTVKCMTVRQLIVFAIVYVITLNLKAQDLKQREKLEKIKETESQPSHRDILRN
jgi:hypothetical protein